VAIDFPASPTTGQQYAFGGVNYTFTARGVWAAAGPTVPATPFDALAYNGMQINGSMDVSQERGTVGTTVVNTFVMDGWRFVFGGTMVVTAAQALFVLFPGFPNFLQIAVTTAQATLLGSDYVVLIQNIEGYRVARLGWGASTAQPITIAFWTCHARTGTYSVSIQNHAGTRGYFATYTQNIANVPQYQSITVPGCPDGTWDVDNSNSVTVNFVMAAGSALTASTANVWISSNVFAAPGQVNGVAATSDFFRITGVVVLPGTQAPTGVQSPLIMRPYDQELTMCKRYWEKMHVRSTGVNSYAGMSQHWFVEKRAPPTVTYVDDAGTANCVTIGGINGIAIAGGAVATSGTKEAIVDIIPATSPDGTWWSMTLTGDARFF